MFRFDSSIQPSGWSEKSVAHANACGRGAQPQLAPREELCAIDTTALARCGGWRAPSAVTAFAPSVAALDGYACGWRVGANKRGTKTAQHAGSVAGFGANILRGLQDDYLIVVLSNDQITAMKITAACEGKLFGTR